MRTILYALILFLCILCATPVLCPTTARAQDDEIAQRRPPVNLEDETIRRVQREQEKKRNKLRQEDLKKDTDKLLQLATELKVYVDKTNENVMSIDVIKKAAEIEKLSKEVQKKMRAE